jgi:hypothetical protein
LLGAHHILHVSRIRVKQQRKYGLEEFGSHCWIILKLFTKKYGRGGL